MNLRNLAIWAVIVVVLIGLYSMMTGGSHAAGASDSPGAFIAFSRSLATWTLREGRWKAYLTADDCNACCGRTQSRAKSSVVNSSSESMMASAPGSPDGG